MKKLWLIVFLTALFLLPAPAEEGMYLLDRLPMEKLKALGLKMSADEIYHPERPSISDAVIIVDGGGTGAFVSASGLILTNHHVAYGALQKVSTPGNNYIEDGFYASTPQEEIPSPNSKIQVLLGFEDVTPAIMAGISDQMDPVKRNQKIQRNILALTKKTEAQPAVDRVDIVAMFSGKYYQMYKYKEIKDIRIVYAPPASIGIYGGDIDNWMWPRHTGDFTFLRAYVTPDGTGAEYSEENVPFIPKKHLPISIRPIHEGDLNFIMGHPGSTQRYRSSHSARYNMKYSYPDVIATFRDLIGIIETSSEGNKEIEIKYIGLHRGLNNSMKNRQGMLDGFNKLGLLQSKLELEAEITDFISRHPRLIPEYGTVIDDLGELYRPMEKTSKRDTYFNYLRFAGVISNAITCYRWSLEKTKPELEREPGFDDDSIQRMKESLPIRYRNMVPEVDARFLQYFLSRLAELPAGIQYPAIMDIYRDQGDKGQAISTFVEKLYAKTRVKNLEDYQKMLNLSTRELRELKDPAIEFACRLYPSIRESELEAKRFNGAVSKLRPRYAEVVAIYRLYKDHSRLPSLKVLQNAVTRLYPDATFTQRFTYGTIEGYSPADAVTYLWKTTLAGVAEKHTGKDPFNAPDRLLELHRKQQYGPYADPQTGEMIVNFLHTTDITGGNSGSPVINARGEYIGIAFDGNYEAMTSDWLYDPDLTRTISCDARYILFIVDQFSDATNLLQELDIRQ